MTKYVYTVQSTHSGERFKVIIEAPNREVADRRVVALASGVSIVPQG